MEHGSTDFLVGYLWISLSIIAGIIASSRNRFGLGYFILSLIVSPLIVLILVLGMPPKDKTQV